MVNLDNYCGIDLGDKPYSLWSRNLVNLVDYSDWRRRMLSYVNCRELIR